MKTLYEEYMKDKEFRRYMIKENFIMKITEGFYWILEKIRRIYGRLKG